MLKITEYAQRLIDDLDDVDYLDKIKAQQKNWIGRSEGAEVNFKISGTDKDLYNKTRHNVWSNIYGCCARASNNKEICR